LFAFKGAQDGSAVLLDQKVKGPRGHSGTIID
jgi:hypothetical protein